MCIGVVADFVSGGAYFTGRRRQTTDIFAALEKGSGRAVASQDFEQTYIEPLPGHVERAISVMAEIDLLLKKVRSDCE